MATQTTNMGLVKPELQDNFNLKAHLNDNWDKIDANYEGEYFRNAVVYKVKNNYGATALSPLFNDLKSGTTIYFPRGTYFITDFVQIDSLTDIKIVFAKGALIRAKSNANNGNSIFSFTNCTNVEICGANLDGKNVFCHGISFSNCTNVKINGGDIKTFGYKASTFSSGIRFYGANTNVNIYGVHIHHIVTGTLGDEGYGYSAGIAINSTDSGYTSNVTIDNCEINNIQKTGTVLTDGDGIFIIQRPTTADDKMLCNIHISNCYIHDCELRCIKASCREVKVDNCLFESGNKFTRGNLVDFQFAENSSIKNCTLNAKYRGCISVNVDNGVFVCENNSINGNAINTSFSGQGIVFNRRLSSNTAVYTEPQTLIVKNNKIDNVNCPILFNYEVEEGYSYNAIIIRDNTIGHFRGDTVIKVDPNRVTNVNSLIIDGISFIYGSTSTEISRANNTFYNAYSPTTIVYLGSTTSHINPSAVICLKNIVGAETDGWKVNMSSYNFSAPQKAILN